jgi:hypothetical protein
MYGKHSKKLVSSSTIYDVGVHNRSCLQFIEAPNQSFTGQKLDNVTFISVERAMDLTFIESLHNLKRVYVSDYDSSCPTYLNLSPFLKVKNFTSATKKYSNVSLFMTSIGRVNSWDVIGKLVGLTELSLHRCQLETLDMLTSLINLKKLDVSSNRICSLAGIGGLTRLKELNIETNRVLMIRPIINCTHLEKICLSGNIIIDLDVLYYLPKLKKTVYCGAPRMEIHKLDKTVYPGPPGVEIHKLEKFPEPSELERQFNTKLTMLSDGLDIKQITFFFTICEFGFVHDIKSSDIGSPRSLVRIGNNILRSLENHSHFEVNVNLNENDNDNDIENHLSVHRQDPYGIEFNICWPDTFSNTIKIFKTVPVKKYILSFKAEPQLLRSLYKELKKVNIVHTICTILMIRNCGENVLTNIPNEILFAIISHGIPHHIIHEHPIGKFLSGFYGMICF